MAQRRFNRGIVAGLILGYVGMLMIVTSLVSDGWFLGENSKKLEGLFQTHTIVASACQAMMMIGFLLNFIACGVGMASSFAVTRPKVAGMAMKKLKMQPARLTLGPKIAGWFYVSSGTFVMIVSSVAEGTSVIGYSVFIAWIACGLCLVSGFLLICARPPDVPVLHEDEEMGNEGPEGIFNSAEKETESENSRTDEVESVPDPTEETNPLVVVNETRRTS